MDPAALIGRRIAGRYQLEQLIGRGGFGAVYRATHHPLGRTVAVKVSLQARDGMLARFEREARVQAGIRHPGCVFLLDYGQEEDGLVYMVQEFVRGQSLHQLLAIERVLEPFRAIELTIQLLDALDEAHAHGVVHRDVKPGNVMVTVGRNGREEVRILDFGIAKIIGAEEDDERLTATGLVLGTPKYMAPEQIRQRTLGPATDVYAVGAMLFRMVSGRAPFLGDSPYDIIRQHMETDPPGLAIDEFGLTPLIHRAMAKDPDARFATAGQMRAALAAALGPPTRLEAASSSSRPPHMANTSPETATLEDTLREGSASVEARADGSSVWGQRLSFGLGALLLIALGVAVGSGFGREETSAPPDPVPTMTPTFAHDVALVQPDPADAEPADAHNIVDAMVPDAAPIPDAAAARDATRLTSAHRAPRTRRSTRRGGRRRSVVREPDAAPPTTLVEAPEPQPPKAPVRVRHQPTKTDPAVTRARDKIRSGLARCHCNWALREINKLRELDAEMAAGLESEHTERCVTLLPGVENCLSRAREDHQRENSR